MAAFPQLGTGFKTNRKTIPNSKPSEEALMILNTLSEEELLDIFFKEYPHAKGKSKLVVLGMLKSFETRADEIVEKYL